MKPALELALLAVPIIQNYPKLLQPRKQGQAMPRWRWRLRSSPKILGGKLALETTFSAVLLFCLATSDSNLAVTPPQSK
ncbi:MAG TPA: hypothetical protein VKM56_01505 [Verrucomicrobiae bacterium]|nr:hypothetical protein [Verrucomicrobiae bacterium]